ncbi:hypothetical protein DE146DRAFT_780575 [Phaeosphaeria sp. MPI-PUGE-AT-0046c]|nr:hypothetical protein DE146DRAFT_780575 [Phaeosphaeria sp. MPI-PUGE-AT-0046c]
MTQSTQTGHMKKRGRPPQSPRVEIASAQAPSNMTAKKAKRTFSILHDSVAVESARRETSVTMGEPSLLNNLKELLQPLLKREIDSKVKQEVDRTLEFERSLLKEAASNRQAQMLVSCQSAADGEIRRVSQLLRVANKALAKLRAVPFPTSLMRCNRCGEDLSAGENVHVADQCGAFLCKECGDGTTYDCAAHPDAGSQATHRIYTVECAVECVVNGVATCTGSSEMNLYDMGCGVYSKAATSSKVRTLMALGHPICRSCLTLSTKGRQSQKTPPKIPSMNYRCPKCCTEVSYGLALCMPRLEHNEAARVSVLANPLAEWKRLAKHKK